MTLISGMCNLNLVELVVTSTRFEEVWTLCCLWEKFKRFDWIDKIISCFVTKVNRENIINYNWTYLKGKIHFYVLYKTKIYILQFCASSLVCYLPSPFFSFTGRSRLEWGWLIVRLGKYSVSFFFGCYQKTFFNSRRWPKNEN